MDNGPRHSATDSPFASFGNSETLLGAAIWNRCYAEGLSQELALGVVCRVLRITEDVIREKRSEPGAVADQRHSPPVGYRTKADLELEVQRQGRLPDKPAGD